MPLPPAFHASVRSAALAFLVTRLVVAAAAWTGWSTWGIDAAEAAINWRPFSAGHLLADLALRYDAQWYLTIARDGYAGTIDPAYFDMRPNFMPLFPLVIRAVAATGLSLVTAGLVVANICSLAGLVLLHQVVALRAGVRVASAAVWVVAGFPSSLFLSSVYSEGLLMAFTMGAWRAALARRPVVSGVLALGASLTRPLGVLVLLPLVAIEWSAPGNRRDAARMRATIAAVVPSLLGLGAYLWWASQTWGDALRLTRTQAVYRGETSWPWMAFVRWWNEGPALHGYANSSIDAFLAAGALAAIACLARRGWTREAGFAAAAVLLPLSSGLIAFSRMVLSAPVLAMPIAALFTPTPALAGEAIGAASVSPWRRLVGLLWWAGSVVLLAWFSARFATWRWVA